MKRPRSQTPFRDADASREHPAAQAESGQTRATTALSAVPYFSSEVKEECP